MKSNSIIEKRKDKIPFEHYKNEFQKLDPLDIANKSGIKYDEANNVFKVNLLNDEFLVEYPSGEILNNANVKYPIKTLILRYLMIRKNITPGNKMINYREVPDGNLYYSNFYGRCIIRLCKTFSKKFDRLLKSMELLKAEKIPKGDIGYKIEFLPNIFVYIILWNGDEEFPPSAQILFSDNIPFYFTAEDLAVVGDIVNDKLAKLAFS
ncbi:MAG: DUF3786 domain-containing protein [Eubacteriaceae bacterium]